MRLLCGKALLPQVCSLRWLSNFEPPLEPPCQASFRARLAALVPHVDSNPRRPAPIVLVPHVDSNPRRPAPIVQLFSGKACFIIDLVKLFKTGKVPDIATLSDAEAMKLLKSIHGVGDWVASRVLMDFLKRADVMLCERSRHRLEPASSPCRLV